MREGILRFRRQAPHPALSPYVQTFWEMDSTARVPAEAGEVRYLHPDGGDGIVFNFGDPVRTDGALRRQGVAAGSRPLAPTTMYFEGEVRLAGVRFRPGGAFAFFRSASLNEEACPAGELDRLFERLREARGFSARARLVDSWLLGRFTEGALSPAATEATRAIVAGGGAQPAEGVAGVLGLSLRHLERLFREQIGYSPKQLARIVRARRAKRALAALPAASLGELAYEFGYADQAHFTREFHSIIGITPAAYRSCIESEASRINNDREPGPGRREANSAAGRMRGAGR